MAGAFISSLGLDPSEVSLGFRPPAAVSVVGSYALRTVARPEVVVDVAVEIPGACLFKKAHLNYRSAGWPGYHLCTLKLHTYLNR